MSVTTNQFGDAQIGNIKSIYDLSQLSKLDISKFKSIDPSRISLGTELQDAMLIAQMFERGAHYTPKEAAVFATLNRHAVNYKHISQNMSKMLKTYVMAPENSFTQQISEAQKLADTAEIAIPQSSTGSSKSSQQFSQSMDMKNYSQSLDQPNGFGDKVQKWLKDCIPCDQRLGSWLQINPNVDLVGVLEASAKGMADFLNGIGNLLRNLDVFGDFCALMDLFNFTCIPDLQRILMLLSTLLSFEMPDLGGLLGLVQMLIAPLFSSVLGGIIGLLDQFTLLVANPLECIVDALNLQIEKLPKSDNPYIGGARKAAEGFNANLEAFSQDTGEALSLLKNFITLSISMVKEKLNFYLGDLSALMGDMSSNDASYIAKSLRKLQIVRLTSFVTALITALASGNIGFCKGEGPPEAHEIDNFYNNYLGPNMSFAVSVDEQGNLVFTEKGLPDLPNRENVFEFEGKDIIDERVVSAARSLTEPVKVVKKCRLQVTASEATTLNQYISELNSL